MSDLAETAAAVTAQLPGANQEPGPDTPSADYKSMRGYWDKVDAMAGGIEAMRAAAKKYLPRFELEGDEDYKCRVAASPFTNVYEDVSQNLGAKPFSREVKYEDEADVAEVFLDFYEDVDGRGNNLHVFAEATFQAALDYAVDWILVDYTKMPPLPEGRTARSQDEETALGARTYWVAVAATSVIAVYSDVVDGKEVFTHFRMLEPTLVRTGYKEEMVVRVREWNREQINEPGGHKRYGPATWELKEKRKDDRGREYWATVDGGEVPIGVIPVVPFFTGKRVGNGWAFKPPLRNLTEMQLDAFQQESNLRNLELLTCYPMLTASGVNPPQAAIPGAPGGVGGYQPGKAPKVAVGPRAVLFAPPVPGSQPGKWEFIEPSAQSVTTLSAELGKTWNNMREIGMQPMAESNITVITSANVSVKAKSRLQAWALKLKDALEQAMVLTALWEKQPEDRAPGVDVYRDFGVDLQSGKELDTLTSAFEKGALSGETLRSEYKRRNVLADSFDEEEEKLRLANEAAAAAEPTEGEEDLDPVTGNPLSPANDQGGEPLDPGEFESEDDIDDATLEALFGDRARSAV